MHDSTEQWKKLMEEAEADSKNHGRFKIWYLCVEQLNLSFSALREWMEENDTRLAECVAEVPPHWRKITMPNMRYPGECFSRAIQFLKNFGHKDSQDHDAVYVFGNAACGGLDQHGWVELEDRIVFDGVQQQFYTKTGYYESEHATPWYRFTRPAVVALWRRIKFSSNLRWDRLLDLPWARDPANPLTVTLDLVKERLSKGSALRRDDHAAPGNAR